MFYFLVFRSWSVVINWTFNKYIKSFRYKTTRCSILQRSTQTARHVPAFPRLNPYSSRSYEIIVSVQEVLETGHDILFRWANGSRGVGLSATWLTVRNTRPHSSLMRTKINTGSARCNWKHNRLVEGGEGTIISSWTVVRGTAFGTGVNL